MCTRNNEIGSEMRGSKIKRVRDGCTEEYNRYVCYVFFSIAIKFIEKNSAKDGLDIILYAFRWNNSANNNTISTVHSFCNASYGIRASYSMRIAKHLRS